MNKYNELVLSIESNAYSDISEWITVISLNS